MLKMKNKNLKSNNRRLVPIRFIVGYSLLAIVSGLSGFAFITIINKVISDSLNEGLVKNNNYEYMFLAAIVVFFVTRRLLSAGVINLSQKIFWQTRQDIIKLVLKAPYLKLQQYKDEVYSTLTTDVNNITNASVIVITFFSSVVLIISCLVYMAYLSLSLFGLSLGVILIGIFVYMIRSKKSNLQLKTVRELERGFINVFNSILNGSKEININKDKGNDIYKGKLVKLMNTGKKTYVKAFIQYLNSEIISQLLFYGLITFILLYANNMLNVTLDVTISFVLVLLYLLGPLVTVMTVMPSITRARISLQKMNKLKKELQNVKFDYQIKEEDKIKYRNFNKLELKDYSFSYGENKFSVGPISLNIKRNDVVFIQGGNGAGKTTFINTILKLYDIDEGRAYIDNELIPLERIEEIKEMFSPIFSDFYLFDEFYGINNVEEKKVCYYLKMFELEDKVSLIDGKFSTIDLSTGQRKRLALISSLLEDRPIIVLDEWAADQDPHFRHKFYTEIIPELSKIQDKTIIAITHDDKYFNLADHLLKMEFGRLIEINKTKLDPILQEI
ncbi:cyclic peptide export ABC transporter [Aquimarina sp. AD1]|nr:cyclic peptide export ABC transporter [Aquimarina sp. AD1]